MAPWRGAVTLGFALLLGGNGSLPADPPEVPLPAPIPPPPGAGSTGELTQGGWLRGNAGPGAVRVLLDSRPVPLGADGGYFIAFDRDAGPEARLRVERADGSAEERTLAVAPRAWRIEHINAPLRPGKLPSGEFQRIRAGELARIKAARATVGDAQGWRQQFIAPAPGRFSGRFGSQRVYQGQPGAYHSGLDIAGGAGATIVAPADGVVILAAAAPFTLEGNLIMLDHGAGLNSAFLHCSAILVKEGDRVARGQPIGRIGATGRATGPHLHWSLKWGDARLDPLLFLNPAIRGGGAR